MTDLVKAALAVVFCFAAVGVVEAVFVAVWYFAYLVRTPAPVKDRP